MFSHECMEEWRQPVLVGSSVIALYYRGEEGDEYAHNIYGPAQVRLACMHACVHLLCSRAAIQVVSCEGFEHIGVQFWDGRRDVVTREESYATSADAYDEAVGIILARQDAE